MAFPGGIDLSTFRSDHKESSGWDIYNITAMKRLMPSEDEDPNFTVITFEINLKRKMVFSTYILTLPCVFLACLTLVVFWLPPERPDRTALGKYMYVMNKVLTKCIIDILYVCLEKLSKNKKTIEWKVVRNTMTLILSHSKFIQCLACSGRAINKITLNSFVFNNDFHTELLVASKMF